MASMAESEPVGAVAGSRAPQALTRARAVARHVIRRRISAYPSIYLPLMRRKFPGAVLDRDTDLVIDGFTRSAGTFAVVAFQLAQNGHVRLAHHLHAAAHLKAAARRGVPAIVPIRRPEETVLSAIIREPLVPVGQFLRSYVDFHARISPYRGSQVVATFEQVTTDFGSVIGRLNSRFGTGFREFHHDEADVERCLALIEERSRRPPWEHLLGDFLSGRMSADEYEAATAGFRSDPRVRLAPVPENRVQRPSEERRAIRDSLAPLYHAPRLARLREEAERLYELMVRGPTR
jgi:hypothetical protein